MDLEVMTQNVQRLKSALDNAEAIVIGAGAGLSASAGLTYTGERFEKYFSDFGAKYGIKDMYSGGFCLFENPEEFWAYWSRYIYINRYMKTPKQVYERLYALVRDKDYFVITTNVDHCFQKAGFDKYRLFYTQGDYGLLQCSKPCCQETFDNEQVIREMVLSQGYEFEADGTLTLPEKVLPRMTVPNELIPYCPHCGSPLTMNLRTDDKFVEDDGWHMAAMRYSDFLRRHKSMRVLFLELAVGYNTPTIIKYSFWRMVHEWKNSVYACVNRGETYAPEEIKSRAICISGDAGDILTRI